MVRFYNVINFIVFIKNWFMYKILRDVFICIVWNIIFYVYESFNLLFIFIKREEFWSNKEEISIIV